MKISNLIVLLSLIVVWPTSYLKAQTEVINKDAVKLKRDKVVERELATDQTHRYRIKLRGDEFLSVAIEPRKTDLSVKLTTPDGEQIAQATLRHNTTESTPLSVIAQSKGYHSLELRAPKEAADAGSYRLEIAELRKATEQDRNRLAAERKIFEANQLRDTKKGESLRQAVAIYQEALPLWRAAGDRKREAETFSSLGRTFSSLNDFTQARDSFQQALSLYREVKDPTGEGKTLNEIGHAYNSMRDYRQAVNFYEQSLIVWQAAGDRKQQATMHRNIGLGYFPLGEYQKANDYFNQSLTIWRELKNRGEEATTLRFIAKTLEFSNKRGESLEYYAQARTLRREDKNQAGEAEILLDMGNVARNTGDNRKALEYFQDALPLWRAVDNRDLEASTLNFLGLVSDNLGEYERASDYYTQALAISRERKNQRLEATVISNLGHTYISLGETRKALEYFHQALPMRKAAQDKAGEASTLNNLGTAHAQLGESEQALNYYNQALPIWQELKSPEEGKTLNNIGESYDRLGEKQKALDYYDRGLVIVRKSGTLRGVEAGILINTGTVYALLGEKQTAIDYYEQALPICQATGDLPKEAKIYHLLGFLYHRSGEFEKSLEYRNKALQIWPKLGDRRGEANTRAAIGFAYADQKETEKALGYFSQALPMHRDVGNRGGESDTLTHIGKVHLHLNQYAQAREYLEQSLKLAQAINDPSREAETRYELARAHLALGDHDQAHEQIEETLKIVEALRTKVDSEQLRVSYFATVQRYYDFYIDLLMRMHERRPDKGFDGLALQAGERARARSLLDLLGEARADIRSDVEGALIERERRLQQLMSDKAELQIRLRLDPKTQGQAEMLTRELQALGVEYQEVRAQIRVKSPRYAALTQPQPLTLKEIQQQVLDAETLLLAYSLGEERSFLWAITPNSMTSYVLPKRAEIEDAARQAYGLLRTPPKTPEAEEDPGRRLKHISEKSNVGKKTVDELSETLNELSRMLLAPVAAQLDGKRLLIVADGALQYVPFAVLPSPGSGRAGERESGRTRERGTSRKKQISSSLPLPRSPALPLSFRPLIVDHEIVSLPSASTIAVLRRELAGRKPAPKTLALLADPVFEQDDERVKSVAPSTQQSTATTRPKAAEERILKHIKKSSTDQAGTARIARLPYTREEAQQIAALVPAVELKQALDFAANRATATDAELSQYRLVHFATHGYLDSEQPELSAIVLSLVDEKGVRQNGFLRTHEVFNLKLPAEVVVLSACDTGLGKEIRGEGLVGLTRGFMYAGAPRVVVSLWSINDRATAKLMTRFYRKLLTEGSRPAAALRAAQVETLKEQQWSAPYYWGAFVLQGEWR